MALIEKILFRTRHTLLYFFCIRFCCQKLWRERNIPESFPSMTQGGDAKEYAFRSYYQQIKVCFFLLLALTYFIFHLLYVDSSQSSWHNYLNY